MKYLANISHHRLILFAIALLEIQLSGSDRHWQYKTIIFAQLLLTRRDRETLQALFYLSLSLSLRS